MAYNNYFPASYQPMYPQGYNPYINQQQAAQPAQNQQQIQNGGLINVRSKAEAQNYPVAPGTSVTFKDETAPFVYTKTMGFSQLDRPVFETFRLVREEEAAQTRAEATQSVESVSKEELALYATKTELEALSQRIDALEAERPARKVKKKEGVEDE